MKQGMAMDKLKRPRASLICRGGPAHVVSSITRISARPCHEGFLVTLKDSEICPTLEVIVRIDAPYSWREFAKALVASQPFQISDPNELDGWTVTGEKGLRAATLKHALAKDNFSSLLIAQSDRSIDILEKELPKDWECQSDFASEIVDALSVLAVSGDYLAVAERYGLSNHERQIRDLAIRLVCEARWASRGANLARERCLAPYRAEIDSALEEWRRENPPYSSNERIGRGMELVGVRALIEHYVIANSELPTGRAEFYWGKLPYTLSDPGNNMTAVFFGAAPFSVHKVGAGRRKT
jgi:hypothetical protein